MPAHAVSDSVLIEQLLTLHNVTKILNVPASTLRYWDKQGLVRFERHWQNDYRQISAETLLRLLDVIALREMNVPIEQIKQSEQMSDAERLALFARTKNELTDEIRRLRQTIAKLDYRTQTLTRLMQLKQQAPTVRQRQFEAIYHVDLRDMDDVQNHLAPQQGIEIFSFDDNDDWRVGMFLPSKVKQLLRERDPQPRNYLNGLLWFAADGGCNCDEILAYAQRHGYRPGKVICQRLSSDYHAGKLCTYYECWLELD